MAKLSPAQIKKMLANPGTRSKLPDKYLPPHLLAKRRANQLNKTLYDPSALLKGPSLSRAATALTDLEFQPALNALADNEARTGAEGAEFSRRAAAYNQQADSQMAGASAAQSAAAQQLAQQLAGVGQQAATANAQAQQDFSQRAAQDAQLRGANNSVDSTRVSGELSRLGQASQAGLASQQALALQMGQAGVNRAANLQQVNALRGQETQGTIGARTNQALQKIRQDRSDLGVKRGASHIKNISDLREKEFTKQATAQTLGIKMQETKTKATTAKRDQMNKDRQYKLDLAKFGFDQAKDNYQRRHKTGAYKPGNAGGVTDVQARSNKNAWDSGLAYLRQMGTGKASESQLITELKKNAGVDPDVASAVIDWSKNKGTLSPANYQLLKSLGVPISPNRKRKK